MADHLIDGRILIAGAGIGGLSAAIALARKGIKVQVLERSRVFSTEGAGIQLGPNTTRILKRWGVLDRITAQAVRPERINIHDGRSGTALAFVPLGETAQARYGAPYLVIHRADLHRGLFDQARALDGVSLKRHFEVRSLSSEGNTVTISARDGSKARGELVVGADGLWSRVRFLIDATAQTSFSGKTAWRTLIDISAVPEYFRQPAVGLWMARSAHLVHYPVRGGKSLNVVAVINDREVEQGWNTPGSPDEITRHFRNWPADIQSLVSCAEGWRKWSLVTLPPLDRWTRGHITLLGDAAHPVLPFLAQGGALAVEDADALASALGGKASTLDDALQSYEDARKRRAVAIQGASQRLGHIYHSGGLEAFARNLMLRALRPEDLLKRYDWLYGFGAAD